MSYIWVLAHTQNVEYSEEAIVALAARLVKGEMRDGTIRPPHPPYIPRRVVPSREASVESSAVQSAVASIASSVVLSPARSRNVSVASSDSFQPGGFDDSPTPSPRAVTPNSRAVTPISRVVTPVRSPDSPAPIPRVVTSVRSADSPADPEVEMISREAFEEKQRGCVERRLWSWSNIRTRKLYKPIREGKWWYTSNDIWDTYPPNKQRDFSHIARIMESELGEQLPEERKCTTCRDAAYECWVYSARGAQQVNRPGTTCARCRVVAHRGGCSLSGRVQHKKNAATAAAAESSSTVQLQALAPSGSVSG